MSVMVLLKKVTLQEKDVEKVRVVIRTKNEEIVSQFYNQSQMCDMGFVFMVPYTVKTVIFEISNYNSVYGKAEYFLYNVKQVKEKEKVTKMVTLRKETKEREIKDNEYQSYAGCLIMEVSHNSRRKILSQIEQIHFLSNTPIKRIEQTDKTKVLQQKFQEISIISNKTGIESSQKKIGKVEQQQKKQQNEIKDEISIYEVDNEGYITLKPNHQQKQSTFQAILQQINQASIHLNNPSPKNQKTHNLPNNLMQNLPDSRKKKAITINPSKNMKKKMQIFDIPSAQLPHIDLNPTSNMFQVYDMCCGQEIDRSHELQSSPYQ